MIYDRQALEDELRLWMEKSLNGDREIYEKLLKRIASMVRGFLMNNMSKAIRTDERVEDLVQDVLIAIHRKKHLYQSNRPILPWLFAIARYKLIDHLRADARRPSTVEWDESFDPPGSDKAPASEEA